MIPTKIKDLFKFIDFLHANIDNFNQNNELLNDLKNLANQRSEVKKIGSFKDRLEYEKIQKEINHKFEKLKKEVNNKITAKAKKYNITQDLIVINLSYEELQNLKDKATFEDLETINENNNKYLTYRLKTNKEDYFSLGFLFSNLDSYFFNLFDYFSEDKTGLEILQSKKNSLPQARQSIKDSVYKKLQPVQFFSFKHDEKDKVLSLDNYKELIEPFSSYQLSLYDDKYTLDEKKQLERLKLAKIKAKDYDFDMLKNRYLNYLNEVEDNPKTKVKKPTKIEDFFIDTTAEQNKQLSKLISPLKGKELAMFISLAFNDFKILNLKSNAKDGFNQKSFIEMQNKVNQSVNKYLDAYFGFTGDNKDLESLKKQLNTILKDS